MMAGDGRPRHRRLSDDERMLWREVTRSIAPLKRRRVKDEKIEHESAPQRATLPKAKPAPVTRAPAVQAPKPAPGLAPLERRQKKRLARGTDVIDARIDLHGLTQSEAHAALLHFLRRSQNQGAKYALVITGKGRLNAGDMSREVGVLKRQVPHWLRLPEFRAYVVGFEDAHVAHGGEGALYVRVRRARA
jgi:DNA-nicking Smr family endonuclease